MAASDRLLVKNSKNLNCAGCGGIHEYISRRSSSARQCMPVLYSHEVGIEVANNLAMGDHDAVPPSDDTVVILDDSARRLPQNNQSAEVGGAVEHKGVTLRHM